MRFRYGLIAMGICLVVGCKKGGTDNKEDAVAAWTDVKGQRVIVIPVGGGNTIVVQPADVQFCPQNGRCVPREVTCPTCDGCNCRLAACSPYCRPIYTKYLEENYKLERVPVTPPGPGPDPAPPTTPTAPTTNK